MKITKNELKQIIKEELEAALSENEDAKAAIVKQLSYGPEGRSYAGSPANQAADLILQLPKKGREELIDTVAAIPAREAIPKLKDAVKARAAQPKKPAEQSQVAKKPATKPTTKTKRVSGTPPPHEMKTVEKDGYVIATATTKDGVVGTGKAKIRRATGRNGAESAAKFHAKRALMDAVSQRRTARVGVPAP
jgi:hypothetical protein